MRVAFISAYIDSFSRKGRGHVPTGSGRKWVSERREEGRKEGRKLDRRGGVTPQTVFTVSARFLYLVDMKVYIAILLLYI
jgi:hypothetical protein